MLIINFAKVPVVIVNIVSKEETDEGEGVKEPGSVHITLHRAIESSMAV